MKLKNNTFYKMKLLFSKNENILSKILINSDLYRNDIYELFFRKDYTTYIQFY